MKQGQEKYWRGLKEKRRMIRAPHILMILLICSILLQFFPLDTIKANSYGLVCGLDEHRHTAKCYNGTGLIYLAQNSGPCPDHYELYSNPTSSGHVHTEKCFRYLTCTQNHDHTDECYYQFDLDNCSLEEHTHDETCYGFIETKRSSSSEARLSKDGTITNTVEGMSPNNTVINLFDYWTFGSQDTVDCGKEFYEDHPQYYFNEGINEDRILKFRYVDFKENLDPDQLAINQFTGTGHNDDGYRVRQGIVENKLVDGFPVIASSNLPTNSGYTDEDRSLAYLFNTETFDGKAAYSNVQDLLQVNSNGYYYYDSVQNFAEYHEDSNSFSLFKSSGVRTTIENIKEEDDGQFFPFNNYDVVKSSKCNDPNLNHYFGMTLTTRFIQDYNGMSDSSSNIPMTFEFSGDDDVWVFIDDVLVGDVGGVHSKCTLSIDFSTGQVVVNEDYTNGDVHTTTLRQAFAAADALNDVTWNEKNSEIFANGTTHTLKFFYLERGNWDSNLSLTYNLNIVPETAIQKVDQYGKNVSDAQFTIYQAEATDVTDRSTYHYVGYRNGEKVLVSLADARNGTFDENGNIIVQDALGEILIPYVYQGVTESDGKMIFEDNLNRAYSVSEIQRLVGTQFIMRETIVPDGYRKSSEEICLYFDGDYLQNPDPYADGVWPSNSALVTSTNTLTTVVTGDDGKLTTKDVDYYTPATTATDAKVEGMLFAVVLKRNGANLNINSLNPFEEWVPLYGNDDVGYTVADDSSLSTIIAYAKAATEYGEVVFTPSASGMQILLENLPGKITRYFTYMYDFYEGKLPEHTLDPQYVVAYFYTTADSLDRATVNNTNRVISHSSDYAGVDSSFSIKWGSTIEVPNFINRLYVQKRDTEGNPVNGASFSLYKVEPVTSDSGDETVWYIADDGTTYFQLKDSGAQDNKGTATIKDDSKGTIYTYTISSEDGVIRLYSPGNSNLDEPNYTITPFKDAENEQVIVTKDNPLTSSSGSGSGDTSGDSSGSDSGTGDTGGDSDSSDSGSSGSGSTDTGSSSTDNVYAGVYSKGINYLTHIPDGYYILREVGVPSGFTLNTTETKIIVSENGVFANAGTSDDYVDVGNGVGYLTKTMDVFASSGSIDETLTWVYEVQRVNTAQTFSAFDLTNDASYTAADSRASAGYGTGTIGSINKAMVSYLVFDRENVKTLYDYRPSLIQSARTAGGTGTNTESGEKVTFASGLNTSTVNGEGTLCLYTDEGWTALEVYQDYGLGRTLTLSSTNYDDIQDTNISNLFSNSTFALYTDLVKVDLTVQKTKEDGSALAGASFVLYQVDGNGNKLYYTEDSGFVQYSDLQIDGFIQTQPTSANPIITSNASGILKFKNLVEGTSYTLEEVKAPTGYSLIDSQTVTVGPVSTNGETEYLTISNLSVTRLTEDSTDLISHYESTSSNFQYFTTIKDYEEKATKVQLIKQNSDGDKLKGVGFLLSKIDSTGRVYYHCEIPESEDPNQEVEPVVSWTSSYDDATLLTDKDGVIDLYSLGTGTYYLKEVSNPFDEYLSDSQVKTFKVSAGTDGNFRVSSVTGRNISVDETGLVLTMINLRLQDLPSTGGFGTWMIILAAVILIVAGVLLRKKKNDDQNQEDV